MLGISCGKSFRVIGIGGNARKHFIFATGHPHLNRFSPKKREERLKFKRTRMRFAQVSAGLYPTFAKPGALKRAGVSNTPTDSSRPSAKPFS